MAWTADDLTALDKAIAQGALRVRYADKEVEYRSLKEMFELRTTMMSELGIAEPDNGRRYASFSKGLC